MEKDSNNESLKRGIIRKSKQMGANIIGFAPIGRWEQFNEINPEYFPHHIYKFTKSVIVLGVQIFIPMIDTTPSIIYSELYNTSNRLLDDIAYKLSGFLVMKGFKTAFFPRDGYGDISLLVNKPEAAFSHVIAGRYAGLGTIGFNHTLLTEKYGPRVRLVSVLTDAILPPDDLLEKDLCIQCKLCKNRCPVSALTNKDSLIAVMDKKKCAEYHVKLKESFIYPCGVCIKVCPVGKDRKFYGKTQKTFEQNEN
jgi:epoxyqueuosine reductase